LDSKIESMRAHFEREAESESSWTTYNPSLGRTLLNTAKYLKKPEVTAVAAGAGRADHSSTDSGNNGQPSQLDSAVAVGPDKP